MSLQLTTDLLCDSIISINKNIQSVAVLNKQGRVTENKSKEAFSKQFPDSIKEMFFMQCVLQVAMGKDFDETYGTIKYYVSERKNLTMLTIPFVDDVIVVTLNKNVSPISLARKILNAINDYKKTLEPIQRLQ